jgi:opacity protein-like surface antigen
MQKLCAVTLMALLVGAAFAADDHPKAEVFAGFDYTRVNSSSDIPAFSANGAVGQVAVNFNKWVGFVGEVGSVHNGNIGGYHLDTTLTDFMFGPRISLRYSRFSPFFHVLLGGVYGATSTQVTVNIPPTATPPIYVPGNPDFVPGNAVSLRASASETAFAWAPGGGIDIKINKYLSFRPVELDYYMMRLQNLRTKNDNNQHCLRYMAGINFTFGAQ